MAKPKYHPFETYSTFHLALMSLDARLCLHAAQTSCPLDSIQLPSELTLESQSCNLVCIFSICFMSNTFGCTQLIRAISSTWSMLPLKRPKLSAFMIRCSISSGRTLVSSEMVAKDMARSWGGLRKTASVSAAKYIFCLRPSLCSSRRGFEEICPARTSYAAKSPRLNANRRSRSHASSSTKSFKMGCKSSSPKL